MCANTDIGTLRVAEQDLRVATMGPTDAQRTLLVFNSIGASLEALAPFAARFRRTRILTFDVPGVGGSPAPKLPYRLSWLSRLAGRLLNRDRLKPGGSCRALVRAVDQFGLRSPRRRLCAGFVLRWRLLSPRS
jgi:hypothetical protein